MEYFGSPTEQGVRIGYYEYRLQALMADPDNYFKNPEPFEGNVPVPDKPRPTDPPDRVFKNKHQAVSQACSVLESRSLSSDR